MDLMPVTPLDHYEVPYFFLDGYQGEIPKGYREAERSRQEKRNANKISPKTFWKDFISRNKIFQQDTSGERRAIQYVNEKGDVILQELTNPEIGNQLLLVLFHNGHETWKKIPDNWTWDKNTYESAKESFFVHTYREYGYAVIKNQEGEWEVSWPN